MGGGRKLKYKDVVAGGRVNKRKKVFKAKHNKKIHFENKEEKKKYYRKRKFQNADDTVQSKKVIKLKTSKPESESESEEQDYLTVLRKLLKPDTADKKSAAIDTDDSTESENEDATEDNRLCLSDVNSFVANDVSGDSKDVDSDDENISNASDCESSGNEETVSDEDVANDKTDEDELADPFTKHLHYELHPNLLNSLQSDSVSVDTFTENWRNLGSLDIKIPRCDIPEVSSSTKCILEERKIFAQPGKVPTVPKNSLNTWKQAIKPQIFDHLFKANKAITDDENIFTDFQSELFAIINNYQDLYYPYRTFTNAEEIRFVYCLHAMNHILKTRSKIIHHNTKISDECDVPEEFRDQGFVRPKVLIIVPFKDAAYKIISIFTDIFTLKDKGNIVNKKRFLEEYTGNELVMPKKNPKPEDYELLFTGNIGDDFRIGIKVTRKSMKLYANFYSADIIIASPLGLRTIIGAEGEPGRDYDFLASIELLIMDQTEMFLMQNWHHLLHIFKHLHLQPKEMHGANFQRVRTWCLDGWSKYYRQTLIFSSVVLPEFNNIFNRHCHNYAGKVKVSNEVKYGSITQVYAQVPHYFRRFEVSNFIESLDGRFDFFCSQILPQLKEAANKQTLIYVPSYYDYVTLRNYFRKEDISFVQICEYSKDNKVARARDMFYHGDVQFMLYTERYHVYNRTRVKGIRHLVFYQLPSFPEFYYEMCNLMLEGNMNKKIGSMLNMTVTALYSEYDCFRLAGVVNTDRAVKMINSESNVHVIST